MKNYLITWILLFALVGYEYFALNFSPQLSLLLKLQNKGLITSVLEISPVPGRIVSLWLGWLGLGIMVLMNLYSMRKRIGFMQNWSKLSNWLNFHIFCGLVGPTFILFHCNFKVRGIVGISFWSMVVSFTSGIIGRYFYGQIIREQTNYEAEVIQRETQLVKVLESSRINITEDELFKYKQSALVFVGLQEGETEFINPLFAFFSSIMGDIRLSFKLPDCPQNWPLAARYILVEYALSKRRALFLIPFQKLMGYWHTFHFPFAMFMYAVAVIHVAAALVLGV